jgi:phospholipid/cholesterol/gamma-HCH transport system substrate-binding protein
MERNASYAFVGFVTLALIVGLMGFAFWMLKTDLNQTSRTYDVVFYTPVNGLTKGGEVHFNGIKVGEVTDLKLGVNNPKEVVATVRLDAETPVRADSRATLEPQGVTGLVFIQITPGTEKAGLMIERTPGYDHPVIKADAGTLDRLLAGSGSVLESALESLNRINKLMSERNIKNVSDSLENIENLTQNVAELTEELKGRKQLLDDAHDTMIAAKGTAEAITRLSDTTNVVMANRAPVTLDGIDLATAKLAKAAEDLSSLANSLEKPANEVSDSTLPQVEESLRNINEAANALNDLVIEARSSPQGLITKARPKEREVKQ